MEKLEVMRIRKRILIVYHLMAAGSRARVSFKVTFAKAKAEFLRVAVYCQSVLLGVKPLEAHDQRFSSATEFSRSQP
jgi:hypothetical protein